MTSFSFATALTSGKAKAGLAFIVPVDASLTLHEGAKKLDKASSGALSRAITASRFTAKPGQTRLLPGLPGLTADRVLLIGLGDATKADALVWQALGGHAIAALQQDGATHAELLIETGGKCPIAPAEAAAHAAYGAALRNYRFDKYRTKQKPEDKPTLTDFTPITADAAQAKKAFAPLQACRYWICVRNGKLAWRSSRSSWRRSRSRPRAASPGMEPVRPTPA